MHVATVTVLLLAVCVPLASAALSPYFRPPAFPIFANNPYWSVWSLSDAPGRSWTEHANGGVQGMTGFAKVDSTYYRFLGVPSVGGTGIIVDPISTQILPLSTVYTFKLGTAIQMVLTFSQPAQIDDDTLVSVPVTYVTFALSSLDGASHTVSLYIDHSAELVVADVVLSGSTNDRINWGNAYMAAPKETALVGTVSSDANCRNAFISGAAAPALQTGPRNGNDNWPVLSLRWNGLSVTSTTSVTKFMTLSYDNVNTMNFFSKVLPPLWSTKIGTILTVIAQMHTNYATYMSAINARNTALVTLFDKRGSNSYTTLLSLVYRQVTASTEHAIDTTTQQHYVFMKTFATSSTNGPVNGQVNAVTTMFFASPFYLLLNPSLVPKMLLPVLKYANSETSFPYTRSWAPSHVGQWPLCTAAIPTTYDMPVEHTANMLIMITAAAQRGAPLTYLQPYWPLLTTWANYLVASLPFPTSQLFVDSYGTASANNVNLAMKGAIGVGAYSLLLSLTGNTTAAAQYMNSATSFASQILAQSLSTDHYLREKGAASTTWSLKYNLLFDRVLKLGLFADAVMTTEQTFYTPKMGAYGLPVDSTTSANGRVGEQGFVAAIGTTAQFTSIFDKLFLYANTTASRLPLGDYYVVGSGANVDFRAGAFVGGLYARELLEDVRAVASTSSISARVASSASAATASSVSASFATIEAAASVASISQASLTSGASQAAACPTNCTCSGNPVTTVDCQYASLSSIPSEIPVTTMMLYLAGNQITSIPASAFEGLTELMELYLSGNRITSIPASAFTGLVALKILSLSSNRITSIPVSTFSGLVALKILCRSLAYNQFTSIPTSAITNLTALNRLDLRNNQITSIPASAFTALTALVQLALESNSFTTLPPGLFKGLPSGLYLSSASEPLVPNNFTFGENTVAPPSTYGSASEPYPCDTTCATCYAAGSSACCGTNCLTCTSSAVCTQCYEGFEMMGDFCSASAATNASIASVASIESIQFVSAASVASGVFATSASFVSLAAASSASIASVASTASIASVSVTAVASTASASAASVASSIAQNSGGGGGSQDSSSSSAAVIAAVVACVAVAIIAVVFVVLRRRRSHPHSVARPKDSTGPIYQEAVEMTISPLPHSARSEDVAAYAAVGQKQPEPLYQAIPTAPPEEVVYDYASAYVAGSNSRRVREGLTIVKHLASGNFGDVALGQVPFSVLPPRAQALLGPTVFESVQVAVKSLKSDADEKSRKDFESEAKLMAPFVHTNVVRLLAALVESEPHLVLLEFVQYGDLRTLLQKSKLHSLWWTHNEQIHAIRQIALGMEYLGTLHFVHRDLAARNCLVGQGMVVKIADFGLSRELASENDYYRMQTRGKLPVKWMAPETMTFRKFSTMSDLWSFGVTAWECFSYGAPPYGKMEGRETLAFVEAGGRLPQPEHCTTELYSLMASCWNIIPELRPSFTQLTKALKNFDDGTTVREIGAML
ncbi:hypothetical protein CAOG_08481 [Capsaspora owczarzaki ATCC 30864]|uniref:TKL protein kinase n=1 Tax=Capsaspora owczarzaki (strain ATCC 30864) TaxID=595528 RepID=A0A0D2X0V7_CAPO3|nr:hypothetical protein CAOG_08481 [Capsaspora owczarzaki ATCC 30864]KJE89729.1 TKL protein kinase [Capsaspora owczarzaki ATCC 30864]|eukprot:XP_011270053.1 hypothetical protein CAOG_08481 [Capsaspora owczarzaki ATCC 30864]